MIKEPSLWIKIDLRQFKQNLSLNHLAKIIEIYGYKSTNEIILVGNYYQDRIVDRNQLNSDGLPLSYLDQNLMNILIKKCPNLTKINFEYLDLSDFNFDTFLSFIKLKELAFKWCNITKNWFDVSNHEKDENKIIRHHGSINSLYLSRTGSLNKSDIENICILMPNLKIFSISQSQSTISDDSIEIIVKYLKNLQELDLINTLISDDAIFTICRSVDLCQSLKRLNLCMSCSLSNNCLTAIADNLINLKTLYLTSCFGISNANLFTNLNKLVYLNLNNTSIDKNEIKRTLLPMLPTTEIEYGHEKMLNRKLMWTINGSRNCVCSF
jgi:hypothetical protein